MTDLPQGTVTFLFTDVEGSTGLLKALGRERYAEALREHDRILREAFDSEGGQVIDTQGDSFFVAFPGANDAVKAAEAAQRALAGQGWPDGAQLRVRMGIHTGEPARGEQRYIGLGVHKAARICSAGHGGQVLLSRLTHDLLNEEDLPGLAFQDLGEQTLKDIDRPERIYQLVMDGLPATFPPLKTVAEPPFAGQEGKLAEAAEAAVGKPRRRRRRELLGAALIGVLAAAVAIPVFALGSGDGDEPVVVAPNSVAVIDPSKNEVVDAIGVGDSPGPIAAGSGSVWVVNLNDRTLTKIDPAARSVVQSVGLHVGSGLATPSLLIAAAGDDVWVWACHQTLFRVDPRSGQVADELEIFRNSGAYSGFSCALAAEPGAAWVPMDYRPPAEYRPEVLHVDAPTDTPAYISERFPVPAPEENYRSAMTIGAGSIWVANHDGGAVRRMDPATGAITATVRLGDSPSAMVFGHGSAWVANDVEDTVTRIDPRTTSVVRAISVGTDPVALAVGPDAIWVANSGDGTVSRIDPATNTLTETISVGHRPLGVAFADGLVWVTVRS